MQIFRGSSGGGGGGGVASVSGSSPIASSGGANPQISMNGGLRTAATTVARNNIPIGQLVEGMEVYVIADGNTYRLQPGFSTPPVDGDWIVSIPALPLTGSGSAGEVPFFDSTNHLNTNIFFTRGLSNGILTNTPGFQTATTPATFTRYVDVVNGNNSNSGTAAGAGSAWQTIAYALSQIPLLTGGNVIINLADGTYPEALVMKDLLGPAADGTYGNSIIALVGNSVTPANVVIQSGAIPLTIRDVDATTIFDGITLDAAGGALAASMTSHGQVIFRNVSIANTTTGIAIGALTRFTWEDGAAGGTIACTGTGLQFGGASIGLINRALTINGFLTHGISTSGTSVVGTASGLTHNFNGGVGASDAYQASNSSVISIGSSTVNNIVNCNEPYRVINGGRITMGNTCVTNYTDCNSGGRVSEDSYFQDGTTTGNTYNYLGTTPAIWNISANALMFAPGSFSGASIRVGNQGGYVLASWWTKQGTITADFTLNSQSHSVKCNAIIPIAVTLPSASLMGVGRTFIIADISGAASTNNITLTASGGDLINGQATFVIDDDYGSARVEAIVGGWSVI